MKKLLTLAALVSLFFFGCDPGTDITAPGEIDNHSYQLIKLPQKSGMQVETVFSETVLIDGDKGGKIKLKEQYIAANGKTVKIEAELNIKSHSFTGTKYITVTIDDEFAAASFSPHMVFSKPAKLNIKFEGLNLEELNITKENCDFVYIDDDGNIEEVKHHKIKVDEKKGKIEFKKKGFAKLNHFSRYGFINKKH